MSEFRKDPLHNKWVLIVSARGKRPHAFYKEEEEREKMEVIKSCPFCEGNENLTPPEVDSFRKKGKENEPGWQVRVFPNKYPALDKEIKMKAPADKFPEVGEGYGFHEVIVETPSHTKNIYSMNQEEILLILKMYRKRYKFLKKKKNIKSVFIFKNHGKVAGASLSHSHSQALALPMVPPFIEEETAIHAKSNICIYCHLIEKAFGEKRVFLDNKNLVVIAPYASEVPYQLTILVRAHEPHFEEVTDEQLVLLADVFWKIFNKYKALLGNIPFNYFINTPPLREDSSNSHWNIQIMPKLIIPAGFEKGTGISINPVSPERAVRELKNVR
jgi:UDPglucose--hexose-1-phosphate uridylyltransferase